jgi:hypothetical protein
MTILILSKGLNMLGELLRKLKTDINQKFFRIEMILRGRYARQI